MNWLGLHPAFADHGAMSDDSPRARAQQLIDSATKSNATLDNVQALVDLIEQATQARPRDIADFFSSHMGANVPWDRGTSLDFRNATNLLSWRDVRHNG